MTDLRAGLAARGFAAPRSDNLFTWLETITYALADEITFTNENQRGFMLDRFPDERLRARAAAALAGQPPSCAGAAALPSGHQRRTSCSTDKINLAYFGVFYATRGLTEVWQALRRLPRRSSAVDRSARFHQQARRASRTSWLMPA